MEESDKLPLKRVELSLSKFNEVAIPHHLDLLRQHKANILKYSDEGVYGRVRSEQAHAARVVSQLRSLVSELESLRRRVKDSDLTKFDQLTKRARDDTLKAIVDYLETTPLSINRQWPERPVAGSAVSTDSVGVVAHVEPLSLDPLTQLQVDDQELSLREREAVLRGWTELQTEVRALHDAWRHVSECAQAQAIQVSATASSVETAAVNVDEARKHLAIGEKLRVGAYSMGGAALGALAGGPAGLLVGAKAGAAVAVAGSLVGYFAGRALRPRHTLLPALMPPPEEKAPPTEEKKKDD